MRSPADESSLAPTERFDAAAVAESLFAAAKKEVLTERRPPLSTYRLQFHRNFRFADAMVLAPYFERLGISHVYASPYFNAGPGSTHGYDVVDHNALNPEIGTWEEHEAFCAALHARALGQLLDFVPNHMGIERGNAMWNDVLENGPASMYAKYFDIDWDPVKEELKNKVLLPVLGDQYGIVLEHGELKLAFAEGALVLRYHDRTFPIAPKQYATVLRHQIDALEKALGDTHARFVELQSILTSIDHLPRQSETELAKMIERNREKEVIKRRLATLAADSTEVSSFIARNVEIFNGTPGEPRSFDLLDSVLGRCSYRLAHWRVAGEEINYRRFFDINSLAAVRVEDPEVFDSIHALVFRWISEGKVSGLRIDHPDGLFDPTAYFLDLQERYWVAQTRRHFEKQGGERELWPKVEAEVRRLFRAEAADQPDSPVARALYVIAEKIQGGRERIPDAWAIAGNTGYRFANVVGGLFVDKSAERAITDTYVRFINRRYDYRELVYEKKKLIMSAAMASEINVLARELNRISEMNRRTRDFTLNALRRALVEFVALFPVYRTYVDGWRPEVDQRDIQYIEWTIARAKERDPTTSVTIFDFLRDILLRRYPETLDQREREVMLRFAMKVQQVTGPVMAKALEDTVFYIYNRLVSLNEVGGEPERFGTSQEAFHLRNQERVERWPGSLCATSTHDTKRSEDVRARISVISELPEEWRACLRRWARLNRRYKRAERIPDANDEYLFYQTLLGAWPMGDSISAEEFDLFRERIEQYMLKAIREAKVNTSWVNPNPDYESAVAEFTRSVLDPSRNPKFIADARQFKKRLEVPGQINGLAQALLKIASPGVSDIYQGCEIWDLSLVDPDNRRPVDFALRQRLLEELDRAAEVDRLGLARRLAAEMADGRAKLYVLSQGLRFKRLRHALFRSGEYLPLAASGAHGNRVVCFCRRLRESLVIAIVPRLVAALIESGGIAANLRDTFIQLPAELGAAELRDVFTGRTLRAEDRHGAATISAGEALRDFPVALLEKAAND
jgi:(1->4)-alpha-D-glucan 1-alpha-D-glucosylmutase